MAKKQSKVMITKKLVILDEDGDEWADITFDRDDPDCPYRLTFKDEEFHWVTPSNLDALIEGLQTAKEIINND